MRMTERNLGIIAIAWAQYLQAIETQRRVHGVDVFLVRRIGVDDKNIPPIELAISIEFVRRDLKSQTISDRTLETFFGRKFAGHFKRVTTGVLVLCPRKN